jgi:CII-binding regulator of phage lambda lysogenization HflD
MEDSKLLLLEQEFHNFKETIATQYKELKQSITTLDNRVKDIEISKEKTDYQYEQIMESLKTLNEKTIPNLTAQIEELKNKPAKRYEQVISGIIGAVTGVVGTLIANKFLGK